MISHLSPFTPCWPRPFCDSDPISCETRRCADVGEIVNHADVAGITNSRPNREPSRLLVEMLFAEHAVAGNKIAAFVEMKVGCCSLWRRW